MLKFIFILIGFLIVIFLYNKLFLKLPPDKAITTTYIPVIVIVISFFTLFKNEIMGPNFIISANDVLVPAIINPSKTGIPIVLPIQFINKGNEEVIIEDIVLLINNGGEKEEKKYSAINELDLVKYNQEAKALNKEIVNKYFSPIFLTAKSSVGKAVLFWEEPKNKTYLPSEWQEDGKYKINIYIKLRDKNKYRFYTSVLLNLQKDLFANFLRGGSAYITGGRIFKK